MTQLPSNRRLVQIVFIFASLLVIQQLVYHLSGVLTSEQQVPKELRHLFAKDARFVSNRRLHLKPAGLKQQQEQPDLPELPDLVALRRQHRGKRPSVAEKQEIIALLHRLASLLSQDSSREALAEILGPMEAIPKHKPPIALVAAKQHAPVAAKQHVPVAAHAAGSTPQPKRSETAAGKIPKILHQTFSSVRVYKDYQAMIEKCLRLNPDWTYYLWTDEDADILIARHFPDMLKAVKLFKHNLEKSDTLRYMILYTLGGIYIDMDMECKQPFFPLLSNHTAFLDQEQPIHANLLYGRGFIASNSAMGATAGHPLFKLALERVASQKKFGVPMFSTGPSMLTGVLEEYRKSAASRTHPMELLPHYVMSPETDATQNWERICGIYNQLQSAKDKLRQHRAKDLSLREEACLLLESQHWKMNDSRADTVAVHKFLHLGYPENVLRRRIKITCFNATQHFPERIHFYAKEVKEKR